MGVHDHGHGHDHDDHGHSHVHGAGSGKVLGAALALTGAFMIVEFVGGLLANSLALLADAGHMLTDTAALALPYVTIGGCARKFPADVGTPFLCGGTAHGTAGNGHPGTRSRICGTARSGRGDRTA